MRLHGDVDENISDYRALDADGKVIPYVRWVDTERGEYGQIRWPGGAEIVICGAPFTVVRWPSMETVATYLGSGLEPTRRMHMHVEDDFCDDSLRVRGSGGEPIHGVRWLDTEAEQVGKLPTDERGCVLVPTEEPWLPQEEVLNTPFRVVDSRDGSVVISSRSLQ